MTNDDHRTAALIARWRKKATQMRDNAANHPDPNSQEAAAMRGKAHAYTSAADALTSAFGNPAAEEADRD